VQGAFGTVVLVVCGIGVAGAVVALLLGRRTWEDYGRHHLVMESSDTRPAAGAAAGPSERDEEIRQMLEARNARRRRRGEPELDIDAELSRLTAPAVDDELRAEIRDLVVARNHRRARQGKPPLDVEAEIERQIAALSELSPGADTPALGTR
jgi:parvulin-like peptidyl-prolyl isomerase